MKPWHAALWIGLTATYANAQPFAFQPLSTEREIVAMVQYDDVGLGNLDVYDQGWGATAQFRCWPAEYLGWAVSLGVSRWQAGGYSAHWIGTVGGSLTFVPVGVSALGRLPLTEDWTLGGELGLRYAFVRSDLDLTLDGTKYSVDVDNGAFGVAGIDLEYTARPDFSFFAGAGLQFNVLLPKASFLLGSLRDSEFEAFFLRFGARWSL
jgi:hypothetical protein